MLGGFYKQEWDLAFTVRNEKIIKPCYIKENGKIKLCKRPPGAKRFMMSFYDFAQKQPFGCVQKNLFFKWLLDNFDLEFLEINPTEKAEEITTLFVEAMGKSKLNCPKVCLKRGFVLNDPYERIPGRFSIFQKLCDLRRKFGGQTQLIISDEEGSPFYQIREYICIDSIRKFTKVFDDVLCEYNYDTMISTMYAIGSRWNRGFLDAGNFRYHPECRFGNPNSRFEITPLDSLNFRVRFYYDKQKDSMDPPTINDKITRFFNLNQTLVNLTKEEFLDLLKFESFDKLPEEIVCRRIPDGKILKFKFAKE